MKLIQILEKSNLNKLSIKEKNGVEITLEKGQKAHTEEHHAHKREPTVIMHPPEPQHKKTNESLDPAKCIRSPMVGTFFHAESPADKPFIKDGDSVEVGDTLCIIEAMKVMNEIKSDRKGTVREILVKDGRPVEYGQPLFVIL